MKKYYGIIAMMLFVLATGTVSATGWKGFMLQAVWTFGCLYACGKVIRYGEKA